tara:strand:+ start:184 stop:456 length:273 start_codon:yes stop_codon:yes gene_type:complete
MKTNVITIEKDVPIPELRYASGKVKYKFLDNMKVGDSFIINGNTPDYRPKGVRQYLYGQHFKTGNKRRYTIRTLSGPNKNPSSIRCWRIK